MEDLANIWWAWIAAALVLAIAETLLPGFIFLGFAAGAAVVGILLLIVGPVFGLPMLALLFAVFSLLAWLIMRRVFTAPRGQRKIIEHDIND